MCDTVGFDGFLLLFVGEDEGWVGVGEVSSESLGRYWDLYLAVLGCQGGGIALRVG